MSKLISELPPELQELCHKRQKEQGNDGTFCGKVSKDRQDGNFIWENTPEGHTFWMYVADGKDMTYHPLYPLQNYQIY